MAQRFIKNALLVGVPFGLVMGLFFIWRAGIVHGSIAGVGCGISFGLIMAAFAELQRKRLRSSDGVFEGESVIFEGPANHFLSGEGRGGWLTLTSTRLVFRSHGNNLQNGTLHLGLDQMLSVTPRRTILFIPYRLRVHRTDGGNETFVVQDGMDWAKRIAEQIERVRQNRCA